MGKTFVEDERPCDQCVNRTRYGCASWDCKFIDRDEAIKAWKEKHEMADRKTEPTISKMEQVPNCVDCTHYGDYEVCKDCDDDYNKFKSYYEPKTEPQTERSSE